MGNPPHLLADARLRNGSADTLALAISGLIEGGLHNNGLMPPDTTGPGWFALVVGRDTLRLASNDGRGPQGRSVRVDTLVLGPGAAASVRVWTPVFYDHAPALGAHSHPSDVVGPEDVEALRARLGGAKLLYVPNVGRPATRDRVWVDSVVVFPRSGGD